MVPDTHGRLSDPRPELPRPDAGAARAPRARLAHRRTRRLARGRELVTLAERHLDGPLLERLRLRFGWNHKGWLDHDDLLETLDRLCRLERTDFRGHPELVPVVDTMFEAFEMAATKPDHVLLVLTDA